MGLSKRVKLKEFLEYDIFDDIEPGDWDFDRDGLWIPKSKTLVFKKSSIDNALRKIDGDNWKKPFSISKNGRTEYKRYK